MNWDYFLWKLITAFSYFAIMIAAYKFPKFLLPVKRKNENEKAKIREKIVQYISAALVVAVIAFLLGFQLGKENSKERALALFIILYIPCCYGFRKAFETDRDLTPEERQKKNSFVKNATRQSDGY